MFKTLPHATYRIASKRGEADCAVAAMAMVFRLDYEEVLIASARIAPHVWRSGLHATEMTRIARRLKVKVAWKPHFDPDEDTGLLWVSHRDSTKEHCVVLIEGWIYDVDHNPVSLWRYSEYCTAQNAYGSSLLQVIE